MTTIYNLKPAFQNLLRPMVKSLANAGITANQVTIFATLLSIITGIFIAINANAGWPLLLLPVVLFMRMALNAIDGMLAREFDMQSALGGFLNELGDVVSDLFLYIPFALISGISPTLVFSVIFLALLSEMTGVIAIQVGASRRYDGPMGKSDRAFVFGALALALGSGLTVSLWVNVLLAVMMILLVLTIYNRMQQALRELS